MAKIPQEIVDRILDTARIEEVVADFVDLKKKGVRYLGLCPFHDDKHLGSFVIYPKGNCFKCFKCDAKGGCVDFLMMHEKLSYPDAIRWLGKKYNIETDNLPFDYTPPPPRPKPVPLPTLVLPRNVIANRIRNDGDAFCMWVRRQPWAPEQRARVEEVLRLYCVGHATVYQDWNHQEHHFTVFWQIDAHGNPRTGHYMKYKPNGKRMHKEDDSYNTDWFHSLLERNGITSVYNPKTHEARQCLFGEHLLSRYPQAPVCIVESEKTAVLMAIAYGNHPLQVWMACCGSSNITRTRLEPLIAQRRRIILYPDRDGIKAWTDKAKALNYDRITIDTRAVSQWWKPCDGDKADIADVVVRIICEAAQAKAPSEEMKQLIDKLEKQ